jgi:glycosyltransferase involved in cell wall biosynthesis
LNAALTREVKSVSKTAPRIPIAEARFGQTQVDIDSSRDTTRLLIISQDASLLNQTTQTLDGYVNIADVFDEVHIIVLQQGAPIRNPVLRVAPNVWLYVVTGQHLWWLPVRALRMIAEQMVFAEGFRPDLIVARNPYESALVAYFAGRHYNRPTQLHILDETVRPVASAGSSFVWMHRMLARYLIARFLSIRTATDSMSAWVTKRYPKVPDVQVLPRFHNYSQLRIQATVRSIKDTYRQFGFVIAYCGPLDDDSKAFQAMDAVRGLLRSPTIGLIFFGDGPGRHELEKRAEILGVKSQVAFERDPHAVVDYLASVDVLLVPEDTPAADEVVIMGAFAEVPVVATLTTLRSDYFLHGESILLCGVGDVIAMGTLVNQLLNDVGLRETIAMGASVAVTERLHEDPEDYRIAYRDSVEAALFVQDHDEADSSGVTAP